MKILGALGETVVEFTKKSELYMKKKKRYLQYSLCGCGEAKGRYGRKKNWVD